MDNPLQAYYRHRVAASFRTRPSSATELRRSSGPLTTLEQMQQPQVEEHEQREDFEAVRGQHRQFSSKEHKAVHALKEAGGLTRQTEAPLISHPHHLLLVQPRSKHPFYPQGRVQLSPRKRFCPLRIASLFNLSIRYWDEGCASLATRTLQEALEMLRCHGFPLGCALHTWEAMEQLAGSKKIHLLKDVSAAAPCPRSRLRLDNKDRYTRSRLLFARRMFVAAGKLRQIKCHFEVTWLLAGLEPG